MITMPELEQAFDYENGFYHSCDASRLAKLIAHYNLFQQAVDLPGVIMELGVFKGVSLIRFCIFRELFARAKAKKIVGFDVFGTFPSAQDASDQQHTEDFIQEAGSEGISCDQLYTSLAQRGMDENVELVKGDICETVPLYVADHPELKISLLHIDVDLYEPTKVALETLFPRVVPGGVVVFDDYATFGGETKAIDEYFDGRHVDIRKFPFVLRPSYMIKQGNL